MIDAVLTNTMLPRISQEMLTRMVEGRPVAKIAVSAKDADFTYQFE
jgi:type VI secretion system protein VasG